MYCENCFDEIVSSEYYEDRLGSIFCDYNCFKESLEYRDIEFLSEIEKV